MSWWEATKVSIAQYRLLILFGISGMWIGFWTDTLTVGGFLWWLTLIVNPLFMHTLIVFYVKRHKLVALYHFAADSFDEIRQRKK